MESITSVNKISLLLSIFSGKMGAENSNTGFHVDGYVDKSRKLRMTRFCKNSEIHNALATLRHDRDLYELNKASISTGNLARISKINFILTARGFLP
jgi:hypothetical protein